MAAQPAETDPSVCYRHPDRTSWTLCSRCGRTICPECQILTPAGVRCPECVREEGGSVRWEPAATPRQEKPARTRTRRRAGAIAARVDVSALPVVSIGVAAATLVLWIAGFFTGNLPYVMLAAFPDVAWQAWRLVTSGVAYPAGGAGLVVVLLGAAIFLLIAWTAERQFGRPRFAALLILSTAGAAALTLLVGGAYVGLTGAIWGIAGAYIIAVWQYPQVRNRILISILVWFGISLLLGGNIFAIIGGALAGVGTTLLARRYEGRPARPGTPYLLVGAGIVAITVLAVLRNAVLG